MGNLLVYTILLSLQIVGFDAADAYTIDVLEKSALTQSLTIEKRGSVLFLHQGDETILEVEQSQLYAHMYTVYTAADEAPVAFNLLEPLLQLPATSFARAEISIPREILRVDGPQSEGSASAPGSARDSSVTQQTMDSPSTSATEVGESSSSPVVPDSVSSDSFAPVDADGSYNWTIQRRGTTHYVTAPSEEIAVVIRLY